MKCTDVLCIGYLYLCMYAMPNCVHRKVHTSNTCTIRYTEYVRLHSQVHGMVRYIFTVCPSSHVFVMQSRCTFRKGTWLYPYTGTARMVYYIFLCFVELTYIKNCTHYGKGVRNRLRFIHMHILDVCTITCICNTESKCIYPYILFHPIWDRTYIKMRHRNGVLVLHAHACIIHLSGYKYTCSVCYAQK